MGRPEFQQIVAQVPAENVVLIEKQLTTQVNGNGAYDSVTIYAPANKVNKVKSLFMFVNAPAGATVNNHTFLIYTMNGEINFIYGASSFNNYLKFDYNYWVKADVVQYPPDSISQITNVKSIAFDDSQGVIIKYENDTDQPQTNTRTLRLLVSQHEVGGSN